MRISVAAIAAIGALALNIQAAGAETISPDMAKITDGEFAKSLTGVAGDPAKGKVTFANRKLGNCLACHTSKDMADLPFHGEVGPVLDGVAERYEEASLRAILINSKEVLGDQTIMPSFYRSKNGARTQEKFAGKPILTAQQVEDVLAYLKTLK